MKTQILLASDSLTLSLSLNINLKIKSNQLQQIGLAFVVNSEGCIQTIVTRFSFVHIQQFVISRRDGELDEIQQLMYDENNEFHYILPSIRCADTQLNTTHRD